MSKVKNNLKIDNTSRKSSTSYIWDALITFWLIIVMMQYITRYYILIPDVDYSIAYIIMMIVTAVFAVVKLAAYVISRKQDRGK
ncbi:hypothetical protein [uncultured Desulfobulbus sp.]|uniref:hypothetical protein n=1 Tax=uncultured Desulfobulbus sp. TaxID=239745 RepID=UPI0029C8634D|nr:hypothetical protein [uncultured Desulfobulbus sp.]